MTRIIDIFSSIIGLILFIPIYIICSFLIYREDGFPIIYRQKRMGKEAIPFTMFKLRTMRNRQDLGMPITIGERDARVLNIGAFIRKYKIDEFPQLWNVLIGEMSLVGPRPELERYTKLYSKEQNKVLSVRPGITDYSSIYFRNENEVLAVQENPEKYYIDNIIPKKLELNKKYIENPSTFNYFKVIFLTLKEVLLK